jgi:hypothetical protein
MANSKLQRVTGDVAKPATKKLPPNAGKGRPKGSTNKATKEIKDMILGALERAGGETYLVTQADENPVAFMGLIGKVIPRDVKAEVTGAIELVLADRIKAARERAK